MKTQPTQGVAIEPIVYPLNAGTATQMSVDTCILVNAIVLHHKFDGDTIWHRLYLSL